MEKHHLVHNKKQTWIVGIIATIIMLVFIAFIMDSLIMPLYTKHGIEEELPDVTEKTLDEAEQILHNLNLRIIKDREKYNSNYPAGTVIFQNPPPFSKVKRGRRISVNISAGEKSVTVPRIIGLSERNATFQLREGGLIVGEIYYEYSNYHPKGVVSGQSIRENEVVEEKTLVDLTISLGSDRPAKFTVPDIVGESFSSAKHHVRQAGMKIGEVIYRVEKDLVPGTVIHQSLQPDKEIPYGSKMNLVVSCLEDEKWQE